VSTDPEQSVEVHPCRYDRRQVKTIEGIDKRHNLATAGGGGKHLQQQRGPPRRRCADQLRELPARQSALKAGIKLSECRRSHLSVTPPRRYR
jgi:hypothetical protein